MSKNADKLRTTARLTVDRDDVFGKTMHFTGPCHFWFSVVVHRVEGNTYHPTDQRATVEVVVDDQGNVKLNMEAQLPARLSDTNEASDGE